MKSPVYHRHRRIDDPMEEMLPPPIAQTSAAVIERAVTFAVTPARYVTVKGAAAAMGLTESSVRKRIERGILLENRHWRRAPDSRIYIDLRAVEQWIESGS